MHGTEEISVALPQDILRSIKESVAADEYGSAADLIRDALRLWQRQRAEDAERLGGIRSRIRRSMEDPRPSLTEAELEDHLAGLFRQGGPDR